MSIEGYKHIQTFYEFSATAPYPTSAANGESLRVELARPEIVRVQYVCHRMLRSHRSGVPTFVHTHIVPRGVYASPV